MPALSRSLSAHLLAPPVRVLPLRGLTLRGLSLRGLTPRARTLRVLPLLGVPLLGLPLLVFGSTASVRAASLPYPEAVSKARLAAEAVLHRAGRESCLRGKLNRALLKLTESCEASGQSGTPLCGLSAKAVVVTPMSLSFMDATSKQLLELSVPQADPAR